MVDKRAKSNFLLKPIILKTKSVTAVKRKRIVCKYSGNIDILDTNDIFDVKIV